jgi:hypothetical protein
VAGPGATVLGAPLAFRPSCCSIVHPSLLLVTCDQELDLVTLSAPSEADGPVLEGIGFVPFDWITSPGGLADTISHDPNYFFPVQGVPFGGFLPVMVNFVRANAEGAASYQVSVGGAVRTDQFHTAKWDGTQYQPVTIGTSTIHGVADSYAVPSPTDLGLYIQPLPGCYLDSTTLPDGINTIEVSFFDGSGNLLETSPGLSILVDNRPCSVTLDQAAIGGTSATTTCGFLPYNPATAAGDKLTIAYTATQPGGFGTWEFLITKSASTFYEKQGAVPAPGIFQDSVADVLGGCTVAAYAAEVWAWAAAVTGWWRCSQYDRWTVEAFALAPQPPQP